VKISEEVCFRLSRILIKRRQAVDKADPGRSWYGASDESYRDNRQLAARSFLELVLKRQPVTGLRMLDFGCGRGDLAKALLDSGAESVVGVDMNTEWINEAQKEAPPRAEFIVGSAERIPLDDDSVDAAVCVDVWEHVLSPERVLRELLRVVRPGGRVFNHYYPWYAFCSSHMVGWVPIPWCHVLFSDSTLVRVAERIHNSAFYQPPTWLRDDDGHKKPFPLAGKQTYGADLNRSSERDYLRLLSALQQEGALSVDHHYLVGFAGTKHWISRLTRPFRGLPVLREIIGPPFFSVVVSQTSG